MRTFIRRLAGARSLPVQRRALSYFAPERARVLLLLGVMLTSALAGLVTAWPVAILIDSVLVRSPKQDPVHRAVLSLLPAGKLGQIIALAAGVMGIRVLQELLRMARTLLTVEIGHRSLMRVRCELFQKLQAMHLGYHKAQPAGDALQRLTADAGAFQGLLSTWMSVGVSAATLVFMTAVMLQRSAPLTALAFAVGPLLILTNIRFERHLKRRSREAREVDGALTTTIHRALATIGLVQTFCREAEEFDRFQSSVHRSARAWLELHRDEVRYFLTVGVLLAAATAAVFGYGAHLVRLSMANPAAPGAMSAGDLMVFLAYLGMLFDPLSQITGAGATVQSGIASAERVFQILDRDPLVCEAPDARRPPQRALPLHLDEVHFEYAPDRRVLDGISAVVQPGELVAFVGPSGAGKSTLMNLLPRLQDPTSGRLRLGDHDLRSLRISDVRRHVALVLQEAVMLPTTLAENIAYGRPDAGEAEIRAAAKLAGAAEFIERLKQGYDTPVLDGGQNLSGGQRQRIGIARALLTRAPILVLDEPTSSLDPWSERLVMQTLEALRGERTIILVTHRLSTVSACDRIFVLEAGRIVAQGTHDELTRRSRTYRELVAAQGEAEQGPAALGLAVGT